MPWQCKACNHEVLLDDAPACPACGGAKSSWTLEVDATRAFVVARKKVEYKRGETYQTRLPADAKPEDETVRDAEHVTCIPASVMRGLCAQGLRPAAAEVFVVRAPAAQGTLCVNYENERMEECEFGLAGDGADLNEARFLFVAQGKGEFLVRLRGEGDGPRGQSFVLRDDQGTEHVQTVPDDGDAFADLGFYDLDTSRNYTLEVDDGSARHAIFEDVPYWDLPGVSTGKRYEPGTLVLQLRPAAPAGHCFTLTSDDGAYTQEHTCDHGHDELLFTGLDPDAEERTYTLRAIHDGEEAYVLFEGKTFAELSRVATPGLDGIQVIDITEANALGHAPTVDVELPGKGPREFEVSFAGAKLCKPRWSTHLAPHGEEVQLLVEAPELPDGEQVTFVILEGQGGEGTVLAELTSSVSGGEASASWTIPEEARGPELYFDCGWGPHRYVGPQVLQLEGAAPLPVGQSAPPAETSSAAPQEASSSSAQTSSTPASGGGPAVVPQGPTETIPEEGEAYTDLNKDFRISGDVEGVGDDAWEGAPDDVERISKRLTNLGYDAQPLTLPEPSYLIGESAKKIETSSDPEKFRKTKDGLEEVFPVTYTHPIVKSTNEVHAKVKRKVKPGSLVHRSLLHPIVLKGSVGQGGANDPTDVQLVQERLYAMGLLERSAITGTCDDATLAAIKAFQSGDDLGSDGRIDPDGKSHRYLNGKRFPNVHTRGLRGDATTAHAYRVKHVLQTDPDGERKWWKGNWTCGPTSLLMAVRYLQPGALRGMNDFEATIHLIEQGTIKYGGAKGSEVIEVLGKAGLQVEKSEEMGKAELAAWTRERLREGKLIISNGKQTGFPWTDNKGGHWTLISGLADDDAFVFNDPGRGKGYGKKLPDDLGGGEGFYGWTREGKRSQYACWLSGSTGAAPAPSVPAEAAAPADATSGDASDVPDDVVPFFQEPRSLEEVLTPSFYELFDRLCAISGITWDSNGKTTADEDSVSYKEQIPWDLCRDIIAEGHVGLLCLFIGAANWGVSGRPADLNENPFNASIFAPGEAGWGGRPQKLGKHLMDLSKGGLGIAHWDSGGLEKIYTRHPVDGVDATWLTKRYDWMRNRGLGNKKSSDPDVYFDPQDEADNGKTYAENWLNWKTWALANLQDREFQTREMVGNWLAKYWSKALEKNGNDVYKAMIWARARSSGKQSGLAGKPVAEQAQLYYENGGKDRYIRQASFCLRAVSVAAHIWRELNA